MQKHLSKIRCLFKKRKNIEKTSKRFLNDERTRAYNLSTSDAPCFRETWARAGGWWMDADVRAGIRMR